MFHCHKNNYIQLKIIYVYMFLINVKHLYLSYSLIQIISHSFFSGTGYGQMLCTAVVSTYYVSLMALTAHYMYSSLSAELPWSRCRPEWGPNCFNSVLEETTANDTAVAAATGMSGQKSSSELYFM